MAARKRLRWAGPVLLAAGAIALLGTQNSGHSTHHPTGKRQVAGVRASGGHLKHHRRRRATRAAACPSRAHVLDGVYHPERLTVLDPCQAAAGRVTTVRHEEDGDLHVDVALEPRYASLTNAVNGARQHGDLVVELMARDGGHLPEPSVGDAISLVGGWVDDTEHGWNELHPVWSVRLDGGPRSTSGPQFGGSPASDRSRNAAGDCRTQTGRPCHGYGSGP